MNLRIRKIAVLLICLAIESCANPSLRQGDLKLEADPKNLINQRFIVMIGSNNYNPYLEIENKDDFIFIEYNNINTKESFQRAISSENLSKNIDKRVICECTGIFVNKKLEKKFVIHNFNIIFK